MDKNIPVTQHLDLPFLLEEEWDTRWGARRVLMLATDYLNMPPSDIIVGFKTGKQVAVSLTKRNREALPVTIVLSEQEMDALVAAWATWKSEKELFALRQAMEETRTDE